MKRLVGLSRSPHSQRDEHCLNIIISHEPTASVIFCYFFFTVEALDPGRGVEVEGMFANKSDPSKPTLVGLSLLRERLK